MRLFAVESCNAAFFQWWRIFCIQLLLDLLKFLLCVWSGHNQNVIPLFSNLQPPFRRIERASYPNSNQAVCSWKSNICSLRGRPSTSPETKIKPAHSRTHDWGAKQNCSFSMQNQGKTQAKTGFLDGMQGVFPRFHFAKNAESPGFWCSTTRDKRKPEPIHAQRPLQAVTEVLQYAKRSLDGICRTKPLGRGSYSNKGLCGKRSFFMFVKISTLLQSRSVLEESMKARGLAFFHALRSMDTAIENFSH